MILSEQPPAACTCIMPERERGSRAREREAQGEAETEGDIERDTHHSIIRNPTCKGKTTERDYRAQLKDRVHNTCSSKVQVHAHTATLAPQATSQPSASTPPPPYSSLVSLFLSRIPRSLSRCALSPLKKRAKKKRSFHIPSHSLTVTRALLLALTLLANAEAPLFFCHCITSRIT
jgi:hypothetical protein